MKALITGASSGIGREFARYLAEKGWDLIVAARSTDKLNALKDELSNVNVRVITIDLSREQDAYDLYEHLKDENIDFLINNAGFGAYGFCGDVPLELEMQLLHTNVSALHILTKLFLQDMLRARQRHDSQRRLHGGLFGGTEALELLRLQKLRSAFNRGCPRGAAPEKEQCKGFGAVPGTRQHKL